MSGTKIGCDDCYRDIYLFIDQELSDEDYKQFEEHLIECDSCQIVLNEAQSFEQELRDFDLTDIVAPENGWEKFQMKMNEGDSLELDVALPNYTIMDNILNNIKRNSLSYGLLVASSFAFFMMHDRGVSNVELEPEPIIIAKATIDKTQGKVEPKDELEALSEATDSIDVKRESFTPSYVEDLEVDELASIETNHKFKAKTSVLPSFEKLQISDLDLKAMISLDEGKKLQMDKFPVTNKEYWAFIQATNRKAPFNWEQGHYKQFDKSGLKPVTYVSWKDADAYCKWEGKSLPSESEWMNAASADNSPYPWGQTFSNAHANTAESGLGLREIGNYPQNVSSAGIYEMVGNVRQWVSDDVVDTKSGMNGLAKRLKIMKGGSFTDKSHKSTIQSRFIGDKEVTFGNAGIRCVQRN
ncbi:MAG: SUMF1/EgtB/PvdO family nonheme iron enzyme [Candidatus Cloacimonetes bacterium]|nr:SUMF1/EgtB/PvdO family nonheme iron enzyme [Candidatus Cloacimonadota bacterium]